MSDLQDLQVELVEKKEMLKTENVNLKTSNDELSNFEVNRDDYVDQYESEMGEVQVCGQTFDCSYILRKLDPTAYNCGFNDFINYIDKSKDSDYIDIEDNIEDIEDKIYDIELRIDELKNEIEIIEETNAMFED